MVKFDIDMGKMSKNISRKTGGVKMKKVLLTLALGLVLTLGMCNAYAFINWNMDLSSYGVQASTDGVTWNSLISGISLLNASNTDPLLPTQTTLTQSLGGNGVLSNGDSFTEFGMVKLFGVNGSGLFLKSGATPYYMYAEFSGLAGNIGNYSNGGDGDTTIANYGTNLANDTFDYYITPGVGTITMYLDTDLDSSNGTTAALASFLPLAGGGQSPQFFSPIANGTFDLVASYLSVAPGVWIMPDGTTLFENYTFGLSQIFGISNYTAKALGVGDDGTNLLMSIENDGTYRCNVIPEPTSMLLLGGGLLGLFGAGRRKKKV